MTAVACGDYRSANWKEVDLARCGAASGSALMAQQQERSLTHGDLAFDDAVILPRYRVVRIDQPAPRPNASTGRQPERDRLPVCIEHEIEVVVLVALAAAAAYEWPLSVERGCASTRQSA